MEHMQKAVDGADPVFRLRIIAAAVKISIH